MLRVSRPCNDVDGCNAASHAKSRNRKRRARDPQTGSEREPQIAQRCTGKAHLQAPLQSLRGSPATQRGPAELRHQQQSTLGVLQVPLARKQRQHWTEHHRPQTAQDKGGVHHRQRRSGFGLGTVLDQSLGMHTAIIIVLCHF